MLGEFPSVTVELSTLCTPSGFVALPPSGVLLFEGRVSSSVRLMSPAESLFLKLRLRILSSLAVLIYVILLLVTSLVDLIADLFIYLGDVILGEGGFILVTNPALIFHVSSWSSLVTVSRFEPNDIWN